MGMFPEINSAKLFWHLLLWKTHEKSRHVSTLQSLIVYLFRHKMLQFLDSLYIYVDVRIYYKTPLQCSGWAGCGSCIVSSVQGFSHPHVQHVCMLLPFCQQWASRAAPSNKKDKQERSENIRRIAGVQGCCFPVFILSLENHRCPGRDSGDVQDASQTLSLEPRAIRIWHAERYRRILENLWKLIPPTCLI